MVKASSVPASSCGDSGTTRGTLAAALALTALCTTTTPTPYLKPIGCAPNFSRADRTQSAHNRKD
jgi:hypothetical protein